MSNQKYRWLSIIALILGFLMLFGCSQGSKPVSSESTSSKDKPGPFEIRWATASAGGTFQVIGAAMLEDVKKANPNIVGSILPGGAASNVLGVHEGKFNVGLAGSDTIASAWQGEDFFKEKGKIQDMRAVATIYPMVTHIVVLDNSGIERIEDLKGKRVSPGTKGVSSDLQAKRLYNLYNISYEKDLKVQYLSYDDGAQQMIDRQLDGLLYVTVPIPYSPIINITAQRNIKLLSIPDDKINELVKFQGVQRYTIPPGTYKGVDYPVKGISVPVVVFVRQDMPKEIVYSMTKTIAENFKRYGDVLTNMKYIKQQDLASDAGVPFHPGAEQYYREKGWLK